MILASSRGRQEWVATSDRKGDHLRAAVAQLARYFGEEAVITNHQAHLAQLRIKNRIFVSRHYAGFNLGAWQCDLAILANHLAIGPDQDRNVVDEMLVALHQTDHQMQCVLARQVTELLGRWTGNW